MMRARLILAGALILAGLVLYLVHSMARDWGAALASIAGTLLCAEIVRPSAQALRMEHERQRRRREEET